MLWRIPIYLRSFAQYYQEAERRLDDDLKRAYESQKRLYEQGQGIQISYEQWQELHADYVRVTKRLLVPPPWWFNDVIGWIEVSAGRPGGLICAELLLPKKRISRQLKDKVYYLADEEWVNMYPDTSSSELRAKVIEAVEELAANERIKKFHLDLSSWRPLVERTDILGVLHDLEIL